MTEKMTRIAICTVVAQSAQVNHVLVADDDGRRYAVTAKTFTGDWRALRRGNVLEVVVTREPLPKTLSARLLPKTHDAACSLENKLLVGVVIGRAPDTPYVLVECSDELQFAVTRKTFEGDWDALKQGDAVALTVTSSVCARVLNARLAAPSETSHQG